MTQNFSPQNSYNGLLKLKHQLANSILSQDNVLTAFNGVIDGSSNFSSITGLTFSDCDHESIIECATSNDGLTLLTKIFDSETQELLYDGSLTIQDFDDNATIPGTNLSTDSIINSLNANDKINQMYSDLNDLFLTKSKVSISVISACLEGYKESIPNETVKMLSNLASVTDDLNDVTQQAFTEIIKENLQHGKRAGEAEKFTFDNVNPYVVTGFTNIVAEVIFQVVATVFTTILTIINPILGMLAGAVTALLSIWIKAKETYGELNIDQNQPIWHITGSVRNCNQHYYSSCSKGRFFDNDMMTCSTLPGSDLYTWMTKDGEIYKNLMQQIYISLNVHPDRFMEYVRLSTSFRTYGTQPNFTITNSKFLREDDDANPDSDIEAIKNKIWLTDEEYTQLNVDGEFLLRTIAANIAAYGMCHVKTGVEQSIQNALDSWSITAPVNYYCAPSIGLTAFSEFAKKQSDANHVYFSDWTLERISSLHQALFNSVSASSSNGSLTRSQDVDIIASGNVLTGHTYSSAYHGFSTDTYVEGTGSWNTMVFNMVSSEYSQDIDFYPVSPKITLPALDFDNLRRCLIAIGIAITAILIAAKATRAVIKKKTYFNRIRAANDLQEKYDQALRTDDPEDKKAFFKARRKFNLKAKIFGWDSYDPTNKWWNPREAISSNLSVNDAFGTSSQIDGTTKTIMRLIRGS